MVGKRMACLGIMSERKGGETMKTQLTIVLMAGVFVLVLVGHGLAGHLPPEPAEEFLVSEDVNIITGLYTREYSLGQNGDVDYKTARQIILSEYDEYWNSVVQTKEFPLFYWYDADHNGQFEMWIDSKVEGCSCDIMPYDIYDAEVRY